MKYIVTNKQMRNAEQNAIKCGITLLQLMQNAGTACADAITRHVDVESREFVILCGSGNNGGDGFVIADRLNRSGAITHVVMVNGDSRSGCASQCFDIYGHRIDVIYLDRNQERVFSLLKNCFCVVECIYGTGFHGELNEKMTPLFNYLNTLSSCVKISVDVAGGCNSDTGEIADCAFKPDITMVLGAMKQGLLNHPCYDYLGELLLLDIGIPDNCFDEYVGEFVNESITIYFPQRKKSDNKGTYGRLLNVAGSVCFSGAAALSTKAALRTGAGIVTLATPYNVGVALAGNICEATYLLLPQDEKGFASEGSTEVIASILPAVSAISIGCGLGDSENTYKIVKYVLENTTCPVILDADGINSIKTHINLLKDNDKGNRIILTPHPKEFSRICGKSVAEIQQNRIAAAKEFAVEYGVILLLKGVNTVIATPDGRAFVNITGNPALAKGGSGDVLCGIIGGIAAQGVKPCYAAIMGAYYHGLCADRLSESRSMAGILPSDIVEELPFVL